MATNRPTTMRENQAIRS